MIAGSAANVLTNPIWVIKTKMSTLPSSYPTIYQSFKKILKEEGMRGFSKGLGSSIIGVSHVLIQFPAYEYFKRISSNGSNSKSSRLYSVGLASIISKFLATTCTYPIEVVRVRCQVHSKSSVQEPLKFANLLKSQGLGSFYKGFSINMLRTIPATILSLSLYETILSNLE
jgi:solute carrier family 25 folate transporter 32